MKFTAVIATILSMAVVTFAAPVAVAEAEGKSSQSCTQFDRLLMPVKPKTTECASQETMERSLKSKVVKMAKQAHYILRT